MLILNYQIFYFIYICMFFHDMCICIVIQQVIKNLSLAFSLPHVLFQNVNNFIVPTTDDRSEQRSDVIPFEMALMASKAMLLLIIAVV